MRAVNRATTTRIRYAHEQDALLLARHGYRIQHVGDEFLFDRAAVEALEGSAYRRLRRELGKIERRPDLVIRPYEDSVQAACIGLLDDWARRLKARGIGANGYNYTKACLREAGTLPAGVLQGEVFEVGGEVAAFGFSGPITREVGCVFISINRTDLSGLTYLVRWRNVTRLPGVRLMNSSTDNGREGLNSIKQSFRPVGMHGIFSGRST